VGFTVCLFVTRRSAPAQAYDGDHVDVCDYGIADPVATISIPTNPMIPINSIT